MINTFDPDALIVGGGQAEVSTSVDATMRKTAEF
jgi:hypothetical protein